MNTISTVTFTDGSTVAFSGTIITVTDASGVSVLYTSALSAAPAPTDTEIDVLMSDGTTKKFVPAA